MKKIILILMAICFHVNAFTQTVVEPDFIGDVLVVLPSDTLKLEHHLTQEKTRANAALFLVGIGKVSTKLTIDGVTSNTKFKNSEKPFLVARVHDNNVSPHAIIQIFKFNAENNHRTAELTSWTTFGGTSSNNLTYVNYNVSKYGESSLKITFDKIDAGEYGIIIRNGVNRDESTAVVSSFTIISDNIIDSRWTPRYSKIHVILHENAEVFKISSDAINKQEIHKDMFSSSPIVLKKNKKRVLVHQVELILQKNVTEIGYVIYDKASMYYYLVHESYISSFHKKE